MMSQSDLDLFWENKTGLLLSRFRLVYHHIHYDSMKFFGHMKIRVNHRCTVMINASAKQQIGARLQFNLK